MFMTKTRLGRSTPWTATEKNPAKQAALKESLKYNTVMVRILQEHEMYDSELDDQDEEAILRHSDLTVEVNHNESVSHSLVVFKYLG